MRGQIVWDCVHVEPAEEGGEEEDAELKSIVDGTAEPLTEEKKEGPEGTAIDLGEGDKDGEGEKEPEGDGDGDDEGDKDGEGAGEDAEDDAFDDEENSYIELYFQPAFQTPYRSFYIRCVLEVL